MRGLDQINEVRQMKKRLFAVLLAVLTVSALTGCKEKDSNVASVSTEVSVENATDKEGIIELGQYKGLEVNAQKQEVPEDVLQQYVNQFYVEEAQKMSWNKTAENGDFVILDFEGRIDGVAFEGGTSTDYTLELGSHSFIDGFEDGMIGMKEGEERVLSLKFPENYHNADYAGKDCEFTVVAKHIIPPISDETVSALQAKNYTTKEEYVNATKEVLDAYFNQDYGTDVISEILEKVVDDTVWGTIPAERMEAQKQYLSEYYEPYAEQAGVDLETFFINNGTSMEELTERLAKQEMVVEAIAENEGLTVSDEELDKYVQEMVNMYYGNTKTLEDVYKETDREEFRKNKMTQNVYDFFVDNNGKND